jgi:transposase
MATVFFRPAWLVAYRFSAQTSDNKRCILLRGFEVSSVVRQAYHRKLRDLSMREVVLLRDNACPHTAALTQLKLEQLGWKTLEHPPYSPDLSP